MKIGIITFTYGQNYGNKLQNYALLTYLRKKYGDNVYTLQNFDETTNQNIKEKVKGKIKNIIKFKEARVKKDRIENFKKFSQKYLHYYDIPLIKENYNNFSDFDAFICGSDQIWNPYYNKNMEMYTASFAKNAKKISYAASIGINKLTDEEIERYKKYIGNMNYIGVREQEGANLLKNILKRDIEVQVDPTMLLNLNEWKLFSRKPNKKIPNKYILTYFIKNIDEETNKIILNFAQDNNLEIINLNDILHRDWYSIDPCEFSWMIENAEYVFSDSFHATVFSLIFHVPFHCFERNNKEKTNKQESRLYTLLGYFGLVDRIGEYKDKSKEKIDWNFVDSVIIELRKKSEEYLITSIGKSKKYVENVYERKEKCCGCGLCEIICPVNAISMCLDEEGYKYPVINHEKCIKCGKCKETCVYNNPVLNEKSNKKEAFRIENENYDVRLNSSSGGVFSAIAEKTISNKGIVISPKFDEKFELKHEIIEKKEDIKNYLGSKYVQSQTESLYMCIKEKLEKGIEVLYTGTPCQCNALKKYLGKEYNNLIIQDLICHGCTSEKTFKEYLKYLEDKENSKIISVNFRAKNNGWKDFGIKVKFKNGKEFFESHSKNMFFKLFLSNYALRPSCYDCVFRKIERVSDITLADFWGVQSSDNKGTSLVIKNSEKKVLNNINELKIEKVDYEKSIKNNSAYNNPIQIPKNREKVIFKKNLKEIFRTYNIEIIKQKIYRKLKIN